MENMLFTLPSLKCEKRIIIHCANGVLNRCSSKLGRNTFLFDLKG
jgi:hypothetical protein